MIRRRMIMIMMRKRKRWTLSSLRIRCLMKSRMEIIMETRMMTMMT
jgi:hypothetical protein